MGAIVLNGAATKAWEHFAVQRAELDERIAALVDEADDLDGRTFEAIIGAQGLDPTAGWELVEEHYEDFGVVLIRQTHPPGQDPDEDLDPEALFGAP